MGKIKRERTKYHAVAVKKDDETKPEKAPTQAYKPQLNSMQNLFAGINIQLSDINKIGENFAATTGKKENIQNEERSTEAEMKIALKSTNTKSEHHQSNQKPVTKKEKLALKHKKLMEKLDATHKVTAELKKRKQKQKQKNNLDYPILLKPQKDEICPMLTPAATKSSEPTSNQQAVKNVFSIPSFHDDLPALKGVFETRKDILTVQTKSAISKKQNGKKSFAKNYSFLKKSMAKKMK